MRSKILATAAAASLLGVSSLAAAQGLTLSPYFGAGAGQSDFDVSDSDWGVLGGGTDDDTDTAWRVFGGVRLLPFVAAELGYFDLGEAKGEFGGTADAKGIDLALLGIVPAFKLGPNQIDVFAKVGGYWWDATVRGVGPTSDLAGADDDFDYTYGVGAQYHFSNFGLRAEWQRYNDVFGSVDTDVWMGSVMFRF